MASSGGSLSGGTSGYLGIWSGAASLGLSSTSAGSQLFWDGTNHRLGLGTTAPQSLLSVANTGYAQFSKTFAGLPTGTDCDAVNETGRVTYDTTGNAWYVCEGASGWQSTSGGGITALTGEVIASGTGSVVATIANGAVTYAKMQNTSAASVLLGRGAGAGAGNVQQLTLGSGLSLSGTTLSATGSGTVSGTTNYVAKFTGASAVGNSQIFDNGTNVGVGTVSPAQKLTLSDGTSTVFLLEKTGGSAKNWYITNSAASAQTFGVSDETTFRLVINNVGNVGIGTTAPTAAKLTIMNATPSINAAHIEGASGTGNGDGIWVSNATSGGRVMALHKVGGVGNIFEAWYNGGSGYSQRLILDNGGGLWIASTLTQNSDGRLKDGILVIPSALAKLVSLRGVSFFWKDKTRGQGRQLGVIAQEVEEVFPEVVATGKDGMKSVSYTALVAPIIEAVKELKADNDRLRVELKAFSDNDVSQNGAIDELRREIDALRPAH